MAAQPLWAGRRVVVCVGTGGVGKTTVSAALATAAACAGLRVLVMTIDPARRLAQIFGLPMAPPQDGAPLLHPIPASRLQPHGLTLRGSLTAFLPDVKATFDDLMRRLAPSQEAAERIMGNTIYQHFSTALAGSHEYAAVETLYAAHSNPDYDLIVLDTPPSQNVVDFLQAPRRILNFLDVSQMPKLLGGPLLRGRVPTKLFDLGETLVTRTLGKVVGADTLAEVGAFVLSLRDMYAGFRQRAADVEALLHAAELTYVLVGTPTPTQQRAMWHFDSELRAFGAQTGGVVLNRMQPPPIAPAQREAAWAKLQRVLQALPPADQADITAALAAEAATAEHHAQAMATLRQRLPDAVAVGLPELPADLEELAALGQLVPALTA